MMGIAVSSMYVREYFYDDRIKEDVGKIVEEVSSEFEKLLLNNDWMDKETKLEALKKLHSMNSNVAYPMELFNNSFIEEYYKDLELDESNYLQSAINIDLFGRQLVCSRFHDLVKKNDWIDHSTTTIVNANYDGKTNSIREYLPIFLYF